MAIGITRDFPVRAARWPCRFQISLPRWPFTRSRRDYLRDGSGWNRGKFDDPRKPEYNFLREVDYCSAACLMLPKSLFQRIGGFDMRYVPLYYEDTDLAFKVRAAGFKVLYQPLSEVFHFEGATGGTDISTGTKKH